MQVNFKLVFFFWLQSIMFSQYLNFYVFLINLFTVLMFLSAFNAHKDLILVSFKSNFLLLLDAPRAWQVSFQDPATQVMEDIIDLHHDVMFYLIGIVVFLF
jgi:hypothetical protein